MINDTALLANPLCIQNTILSDYNARITGDLALVDANNSFCFLIESFSRMAADMTNATDAKLNSQYAIRAATATDLYNNLSDYDYVGFFSSPAPFNLSIMLNKDYLMENAVVFPNSNYQIVEIPADTVFTVGRFNLGIYYPIQIKINSLTGSVSASFDTTKNNPLKTLATNTIPVTINTFQGVDLIEIQFDCYQFDKLVVKESVNPSLGFMKTYSYDNLFYAIRVFDTSKTPPVEMAYTLSDSVYDISIPTVCLKIFPETNTMTLSLPQIYFTSGQVGSQLQVEIYTTLGEINASLSNIQIADISANFALLNSTTDLKYTDILRNIPTIIISPTNTAIAGGSNSLTFEQIKNAAIYHAGSSQVPITRMDLEQFFANNGFVYKMKVDNLTDRRYYAYKNISVDGYSIGVANGPLTILASPLTSNKNILYQNDDTIVILPTALYNYSNGALSIASDANTDLVNSSSGTTLANILNTTGYYFCPYHLVISTNDNFPDCNVYDLITNTATNVVFIEENPYLSAQMSLITIAIRHLNNGSGGYIVRAGFQRSSDIANASATSDLQCFLTVATQEGFKVGITGVYVGAFNGLDVYDFTISTNYELGSSTIRTTNLFSVSDQSPGKYSISLSGSMFISTFVKNSLYPTIIQDTTIANYLTVDDGTWLGISLQGFSYSLGRNLSDVIDPDLLTNWTNNKYQTYPTEVPQLYEHDVYQLNTDGTILYTIDGSGNVSTTKLHSAGDPVLNSNGSPVIKYSAGDVVQDVAGNLITVTPSMLDFTINLSVYEYEFVALNSIFFTDLTTNLTAYYETIQAMNKNVFENTKIFFNPSVTTNNGQYRINNSIVITSSLELSFEFNCYVSEATKDDTATLNSITKQIIAIVTSHLSDEIISMTVIASDISTKLSSYINSIDSVSLNRSTTNMTLMLITVGASPKLGATITVGADGQLVYTPNVTINYVSLDK